MPRMRHRLGPARDADGHERVPALVDLDRRPAKKGRKTKGPAKRSPGSKAAGGHAARDAGDADAEMRWGAELVLQLALGGNVYQEGKNAENKASPGALKCLGEKLHKWQSISPR